jgi:hypothetical protein
MNKMVIQDETPIYADSESQYSILRYAAMAAKWKGITSHQCVKFWVGLLNYAIYFISLLMGDLAASDMMSSLP